MLAADVITRITEVRALQPERIRSAAVDRVRRPVVAPDGKLAMLAADHAARGIVRVGQRPMAMADRTELLGRIVRILQAPSIDGIVASMDLIEDLLIVDEYARARDLAPLLDERVVAPSLNRGGIAGSAWELDDPMTGPSPTSCASMRFDGGKLLLRIDVNDPQSLTTLRACAAAVTDLAREGLIAFLEVLAVTKTGDGLRISHDSDVIARMVGVAQALGETSARTWLKLPYCENFSRVARATTLPILMLGGEALGDTTPLLKEVVTAMEAGSTVRGTMIGRNVLFPGRDDPLAAAETVAALVHRGCTIDEARHQGQYAAREIEPLVPWRL